MSYPKLIQGLNEFMKLCRRYNCIYPDYLENFCSKLQSGVSFSNEEVGTVKHYLFGGMGSLNDLVISKFNKHDLKDEKVANQELENIRKQIGIAWKIEMGQE